ncbi:MAG: YbaK/EbsC family protein [Rhizobiales bacterium]|nr:YbaK/EbsC family protein [Hyphomicrobiales bacterium]
MSVESVRAFFAANAPDIKVIESDKSSATVALAAEAFGVTPAEIAKTLSLRVGEINMLVVTCGTARLNNKKARAVFGGKPRMLNADEALEATGHPVGGICPFGLKNPLKIYCDVSMKNFAEVVPAAGSVNSAVRISPARLAELTRAEWVDVCEIQSH